MKKIKNKLLEKFSINSVFSWLIILGVVTRLFLIYKLPLWGDEAYSIWATQQTWLGIINNSVDPVHPPGYYLFIKVWSLISDHLFWLRLSSFVAFLINLKLIKKLFENNQDLQKIITFLYVFSGYFLVFDWQLRMYTPSLTLILASLLLQKQNKNIPLLFINTLGYFFDYAFFWYGASFTFFRIISELFKEKKISTTSKINLSSFLIFLTWLCFNPGLIFSGEKGIGWAVKYYDPLFHLPYFLGTHAFPWLSIFFIVLLSHGVITFFKKEKVDSVTEIIFISTCFLYSSTLLVSVLQIFKIFHFRSLNIVPLMFLLAIGWSLRFFKKKNKKIFFLILLIYFINFIGAVIVHLSYKDDNAGKLIVHFFPWKYSFSQILKTNDINQKYISIKEIPTENIEYLYIWSFFYTAMGKETLGAKSIEVKIEPAKDYRDCQKIENIEYYWQSHLCPKNY